MKFKSDSYKTTLGQLSYCWLGQEILIENGGFNHILIQYNVFFILSEIKLGTISTHKHVHFFVFEYELIIYIATSIGEYKNISGLVCKVCTLTSVVWLLTSLNYHLNAKSKVNHLFRTSMLCIYIYYSQKTY